VAHKQAENAETDAQTDAKKDNHFTHLVLESDPCAQGRKLIQRAVTFFRNEKQNIKE
jgi:hypothetical protein